MAESEEISAELIVNVLGSEFFVPKKVLIIPKSKKEAVQV